MSLITNVLNVNQQVQAQVISYEPTGSGPSNFIWNKGKQIVKGITEKEYRKEKLDDNF
jgi:hypothetical protein